MTFHLHWDRREVNVGSMSESEVIAIQNGLDHARRYLSWRHSINFQIFRGAIMKFKKFQMSKRVRKLNGMIHTSCIESFHFNLLDICHGKKVIIANLVKCPCTVIYFVDGSFCPRPACSGGTFSAPFISSKDLFCPRSISSSGSSFCQSSKNCCLFSGVHESEMSIVSPNCSFSYLHSHKRVMSSTLLSCRSSLSTLFKMPVWLTKTSQPWKIFFT